MSNDEVTPTNLSLIPSLVSLLNSELESSRQSAINILNSIAIDADEKLFHEEQNHKLLNLCKELTEINKNLREYIDSTETKSVRTTSSVSLGLGFNF